MGRDVAQHIIERRSIQFQSTRPHGARLWYAYNIQASQRFNPRARMGRDRLKGESMYFGGSFNPRARMGRDNCV